MRYSIQLFAFFSLIGLFSGTRARASSEPYWSWRNPLPQGNDYYGVAYGAGRFVAIGRAGTITTSTDGLTWSAANSGLVTDPGPIAYGNGRFVIAGWGSVPTLTSEDGVTWTTSSTPLPDGWSAGRMTFAGDRFFAMSNNDFVASLNQNFVATSTDGVNWTKSASASAANVGQIAFANGGYLGQDMLTGILSSKDGSTYTIVEARMLRSTDGLTWTAGGGTGLARITAGPIYFDGAWVVGGILVTQTAGEPQRWYRAISTSADDGLTWTVKWHDATPEWSKASGTVEGLGVFGGRVILLGDPNLPIASTADFVTTRTDLPAQMIQLNSIAATTDRVVAVGRYGQIVSSGDGANWSSCTSSSVQGNLRAAAFGDGQWIVAGDSGLAVSPDGIAWRMLPGGAGFNEGSVAYGNGRFVAGASDGRIAVSTDKGTTWTDSAKRAVVSHFVFANGRFVGSAGLISSTDGLTWSPDIPLPGGAGFWTGVFTVGDVFYAVGTTDPADEKDGFISRSVDGLTWTVVAKMPERLRSVGGKEGLIVACGAMGEVWTSNDGLTWQRADGRPLLPFGTAASIQWVGDSMVAATYYGQIALSADGISWVKDEFASSGMMFGLAAGNGQILAVGNGGVIWEVGAARFTRQPESRTVPAGNSVTFAVAAVGKEPLSYQWQKDGAPIAGANAKNFTISAAQTRDAGNYRVVVSNMMGSTASGTAALVVSQTATPPAITSQPESKTGIAGEAVTFSVIATGDAPLSYQWYKNSAAIVGATGPTFTIAAPTALDNGTYTVMVGNSAGAISSNGATLSISAPVKLANISARAYCSTGNGVTIGGFVVTGGAPKRVLIRAVGPTLTTQGIGTTEVLVDPTVEVHHGDSIVAQNDDWGSNANAAEITATAIAIGATALAPTDTRSSALLTTLNAGVYSFVVRGKSDSSGIVLLEVYDADTVTTGSRFVDIAARAQATTGNGVAIGGFVISGSSPKQVLIRAIGPTLTTQGISQTEVLADPAIELHHGAATIASNDDWGTNGNSAQIVTTGARIGATPFASSDAKSSALLLTLDPGVYSFIAQGKNATSGIVLVEVYDAD